MPVKGLMPGLPEHGKIKAGVKGEWTKSVGGAKFRLPKKLDHFIITITDREESGNFKQDVALMDDLKKLGDAILNKDGNLVGIPIRLLYNDIDLNFPTRYAKYKGIKCVCSGNGEQAKTVLSDKPIKCPCADLEAGTCKINGKLYCVIEGAKILGACHVLRTTSINTVKSILSGLAFIKTATGGILAFLPLHLMLTPKLTTTQEGDTTTVYISSVVFRGGISDLQQRAIAMAKEKVQYLLTMDQVEQQAREFITVDEIEEDDIDIAQEFYPETAKHAVPPEKAESEPEQKPKAEPVTAGVTETVSVSESTAEKVAEDNSGPVTKDQKSEILKLKKQYKITSSEAWANLLKPFNVQSANFLTKNQADEFIESLKANPI